jgi:anti-anti-sigma factor
MASLPEAAGQEMILVELEHSTRVDSGGSRELPGTIANQTLVVEWLPGEQGLRVAGEVDLVTRDVWAGVLAALLGDATPARLDLSGLSFIDVQGVTALVDTARQMTATKRVILYRPPLSLRRTLKLFWSSETPDVMIEEEEAG